MKMVFFFCVLLLAGCAHQPLSKNHLARLSTKHPVRSELVIEQVAQLQLQAENGIQPVTGASGLVIKKDKLYVVSDDANHLNQFDFPITGPARVLTLFSGQLPQELKARKKQKPDLEAMGLIGFPKGKEGLLLVPSGSKKNRIKGAFVPLDKAGNAARAIEVDFSKLYQALKQKVKKLNIEALVQTKEQIIMLSRGIEKNGQDSIVKLNRACLLNGTTLDMQANCLEDVQTVELGQLENTKLTFTDATLWDDQHLLFLAAAETDEDVMLGSVFGKLNFKSGKVLWLRPLSETLKVEGIAIERKQDQALIYLTSDPDDMDKPGSLYQASISVEQLSL